MHDRASLLDWIGLPEAGMAVQSATCAPAAVAAVRDAYLAGVAPPPGTDAMLAALGALDALPGMLQAHRARGIASEVSRATAADLALWMRDHRRRHGSWGLGEAGWLRHHLGGRLLRLGRLQFMPVPCRLDPAPLDGPLRDGDPVLEVHIPAGEPLDAAACAASFAASVATFAQAPWRGWFCRSWLLGPRLPEVLPAASNIRAFRGLFQPLAARMDDRQALERIFGVWPLDPAAAPRDTALQRAVLSFYAGGGQLDGGAGFRPRPLT